MSDPNQEKQNCDEISEIHSSNFNLEVLKTQFEKCLSNDDEVLVEHYMLGYEELDKFLNLLGTVFGWVASDLQAKLDILRQKRRNSEVSRHYNDVQSMVKHELSTKAIKFKSRDDPSGTRNLLRLHRALEFIVMFMESLNKLEDEEKCVTSAQEAYKVTLEKHHPWIVQKAAYLAMHMLPTKAGLVVKVCGIEKEKQAKALQTFNQAIKAMKVVYEKTEKIYKENNVVDLP